MPLRRAASARRWRDARGARRAEPLLEASGFHRRSADGALDEGGGGAAAAGAQGDRRHPRHRGLFQAVGRGRRPGRRIPIVVEPGPRTTIASVEIGFTGDGRDEGDRAAARRPRAPGICRSASPSGRPTGTPPSSSCSTPEPRDYAAAAITDSEAVIDPVSAEAVLPCRWIPGRPSDSVRSR
jgi:hypothetical protein